MVRPTVHPSPGLHSIGRHCSNVLIRFLDLPARFVSDDDGARVRRKDGLIPENVQHQLFTKYPR